MTQDHTPDTEPGTELVPVDRHPVIANIATGEQITIATAKLEVLAEARDLIVEDEARYLQWKEAIDRELCARADTDATRTLRAPHPSGRMWEIKVAAPSKNIWDAKRAYLALRRFVRQGLISEDAARRAVSRQTTYKASHGQLVKLTKHADPRVRDAITACLDTPAVDRRSASVTLKDT